MIVENPYSQDHYLVRYFPVKAKIIDRNRMENGDYYKKPTQYWFVNCEPKDNLVFEPLEYVKAKQITEIHDKAERSLIHPQYVRRFIKRHIL